MEFKDLKKGEKLYNLVYWHNNFLGKSKRELRTVIVKKNNGKSLSLMKGIMWRITKKEFGTEWFLSKKECYEKALRHHKVELFDFKKNVKIFTKEVKYLKKKLQEVSTHSSHA